jgi:hypothetical protein
MAFRLREHESVTKGLRRVVRRQLESAMTALDPSNPSAEAIHEARKALKKVRAIVKLVGDPLAVGKARQRLRRASRLLSPLRDAEAMERMTETICQSEGRRLRSGTCAHVKKTVHDHHADLVASQARVLKRTRGLLRRVERSARKWEYQAVTFRALSAALRHQYKDARERWRALDPADRSDAFHAWRKDVKTLWYGLRLLEERTPRVQPMLDALEQLETRLGDDHTLSVLLEYLSAHGRLSVPLEPSVSKRQQVLRRESLTVGERRFKPPPRQFGRRLRDLWDQQGSVAVRTRSGHKERAA